MQHQENFSFLVSGSLINCCLIDLILIGLDDESKDPKKIGIFDLEDEEVDDGKVQTLNLRSQKSAEKSGEGTVTGDVGTLQASFNMMKVFIGIGILATPASFSQVGIVGGVLGMILIGVISAYTMKL